MRSGLFGMHQVEAYPISGGAGGVETLGKRRPASLAVALVLAGVLCLSLAAMAQPRMLDVVVEGADGEPLDGIWLRLAGDEPDARVRDGRLTLQLPPHVQPGADVQLLLQDDRYAFLEPPKGKLRIPGEGGGQTTRIVLVPRGDAGQLEKVAFSRSLGSQVVEELDALSRRDEGPTLGERLGALEEVAGRYGLTAEEVDRALQAWWKSPLEERDSELLDRYMAYLPRPVSTTAGTTEFTGMVRFGDDSVVVINPSDTVVVDQLGTKFFLRHDLERLALGEASQLQVGAAPARALDGALCAWEIRPAEYLTLTGDLQGDCSLAVAMPKAPVVRYGREVRLRITVSISRGGKLLDERKETVAVSNGIALRAHVSGAPLAPGRRVSVAITRPGNDAPLPAGYRCSWSRVPEPILWTSTADNDCAARVELSSADGWSTQELRAWRSSLDQGRTSSWVVTASYQGQPVPGGRILVDLQVEDSRDPRKIEAGLDEESRSEVRDRVLGSMQERQADGIDLHLRRAGLPPLSEISASSLRLRADVGSSGWKLQAVYVGEDGSKNIPLISGKTIVLKVLYSPDGKTFSPFGTGAGTTRGTVGSSRDLEALAKLRHYWVKLEAPSPWNLTAGPFRVKVDGETELRGALRRSWDGMSPEERQDLACNGFVSGAGLAQGRRPESFLPVLQAVAVRRKEGAVWRREIYGADLSLAAETSFLRVPRPMGDGPYVVRMEWADGSTDDVECPARRQLGYAKDGLFHRLERVSGGDEQGPPEIEVYVEEEWNGKFRIQYEHLFKPAFLRVATDGKTFATIKPDYRYKNAVLVEEPRGDILHLRFVDGENKEVGYRGPLDFDEHRRTVLLKNLLVTLNLSCNLVDGAGKAAEAGEGEGVRCQILTSKGWGMQRAGPIKLGQVAPILRHIQFGCAQDRLDQREDYAELKAKGIDLHRLYLTFRVNEPCETVYAQMVLDDGSKSRVLVIPVLTGRREVSMDGDDF